MSKFKNVTIGNSIYLAVIVNGKLSAIGASINFCRIQLDDGSAATAIVFQCGVRRAVVRTRAILGEPDADDIAKSVKEWVSEIRQTDKWTTDPKEAA